MKLLELHILKSTPVACLNRDDANQAKSCIFGGFRRARISSQCYKRAIRNSFNHGDNFGIRTIFGKSDEDFLKNLKSFIQKKCPENNLLCDDSVLKDKVIKELKDKFGTNSVFYVSLKELELLANGEKFEKSKHLSPDIAIFGRMVAGNSPLNVEAAGSFSHAISTHKVSPESDFFTCVDDLKEFSEEADSGGAHLNLQSYQSATYYYYIALNIDMLFDEKHLGGVSDNDKEEIIRNFVDAVITSQPTAKQKGMNTETPPTVVALVREGSPLNLVNAFETPIKASSEDGFFKQSFKLLKEELNFQKTNFGFKHVNEIIFSGTKAISDSDAKTSNDKESFINAVCTEVFPKSNINQNENE